MIEICHTGAPLFRSGWFVESLATQALVVFAIRTRRVPFYRSRPSRPLLASAVGVVAVGVALPLSPLAEPLGFQSLPLGLLLTLALMAVLCLVLIEGAEHAFYARADARAARPPVRHRTRRHRIQRRAGRFSQPGALRPR
ncbi:cation transporting ATPase C-terminal domain-containing protein [Streptomyces melanogenes]|uniref:cation transporting ATPase C-terminal domain-containing protein n=1 Tax=Streptomyces melanogenes TaxID=67326 RepID=UPI0037A55FC4